MPRIRIRAHPPPLMMKTGRGVPPLYDHLINAPDDSDSNPDEELDPLWKQLSQVSQQWRKTSNISAFQEFCKQVLGIEPYREPSDYLNANAEKGAGSGDADESDARMQFDMAATDKYIEGILLHREIIAEECFGIQQGYEPLTDQVIRLLSSLPRLSRHAYYGNEPAQKLAETTLPLLLWMLIHHDVPKNFAGCFGSRVLVHFMHKVEKDPLMACWACYCLTMGCINCPLMISQVQKEHHVKEILGELCFQAYWIHWPVNYALILRSILFGPNVKLVSKHKDENDADPDRSHRKRSHSRKSQ